MFLEFIFPFEVLFAFLIFLTLILCKRCYSYIFLRDRQTEWIKYSLISPGGYLTSCLCCRSLTPLHVALSGIWRASVSPTRSTQSVASNEGSSSSSSVPLPSRAASHISLNSNAHFLLCESTAVKTEGHLDFHLFRTVCREESVKLRFGSPLETQSDSDHDALCGRSQVMMGQTQLQHQRCIKHQEVFISHRQWKISATHTWLWENNGK